MISNERVLSIDTQGDQEISVSTDRDLVILADTTIIPNRSIYLTPVEARKLAEYLTEQAANAEAINA